MNLALINLYTLPRSNDSERPASSEDELNPDGGAHES
jgi:hypothetical protein